MEALAREVRGKKLHVTDLPYQLTTRALEDPENVRLWRDETGRLLGWIVMQIPFDSLDFAVRSEMEAELLPQMLAWADERSRARPEMIPLGTPEDKPCWFVNIFADQTACRRILEAAGFADQGDVGEYSWSKVFMKRSADLPVNEYRIPPGFVVRPLKGQEEVEAYVQLHREVFGSKIMNPDWRRRTLLHPDYTPDLDLVVAAPDGRLAAFCVSWLDSHGTEVIGQIEPLGCHRDFRCYALGRVALAEGLRRLKAHGAAQIFVETDSWRNTAFQLYESMGFKVARDVLVYRKDY
jgi:ribosomal protein S18 acetylase RimI-like enzyme